MAFVVEYRESESPYLESVMHGWTAGTGKTTRPAESHWHMVFVRENGNLHPIVVGPLRSSGVVRYTDGAEILWLKFRLGTFLAPLPVKQLLDVETELPQAGGNNTFWLNSSAWQFPNFENVETFVQQLARDGALQFDGVVDSALRDEPQPIAERTVRHRFLRATGLTQTEIRQIERAQRAADLLRGGTSILDTVFEAGYFDQPHLTRALKRWVGHTPAQLLPLKQGRN